MTVQRISTPFIALLAIFAFGVGSASAVVAAPGWAVDSFASPTNFSENENVGCDETLGDTIPKCDAYHVTVTNAGSVATAEVPETLTDTVPAGVTVREVELFVPSELGVDRGPTRCEVEGQTVRCTLRPFQAVIQPDQSIRMIINVTVDDPGVSGALALSTATVSGGGVASVSGPEQPTVLSSTPASFGSSGFDFFIDGLNGAQDTQAGDHPYELTTTINLNSSIRQGPEIGVQTTSVQDVKDIIVDLPLGFVGSILAAPECPISKLGSSRSNEGVGGCPADTIIGHILTEPENGISVDSAIYNLVPERGAPAEFGYIDVAKNAHTFYVHVVPTPEGYVLQSGNYEIPAIELDHIVVTFYGDPEERAAEVRQKEQEAALGHPVLRERVGNVPFFTNPTACSNGSLVATMYMDSWQNPGTYEPDGAPDFEDGKWVRKESVSPPVTGCNALSFTPELVVQPTTHEADKPTGLEFETKLLQNEVFGTDATPALKDLTVEFPAGMTVDPSSADGLGTCSESQIGYEGPSLFDFSEAKPTCPESSKIGSLELETPLIPRKIFGEVYLAGQDANPFGSTFAIYVVVEDPITGVVIKIAGELKADPNTGQTVAFFPENPQLPFSVLQVHFFGGPRAELATPPNCGIYTTRSEMEPWSAPDSGPIGMPFDNYTIDENCAIGFMEFPRFGGHG